MIIRNVIIELSSFSLKKNLVNSISSFSQVAISFNDNLENLIEYEIYRVLIAIIRLHYDIYKLNKTLMYI